MARRTIHAARWQQWSEQEARDVLDQHSQSGLSREPETNLTAA